MYSKKFPFALQTIFSIHNLEADNFFQLATACEQFFYEKGNPPNKKIMVRPLAFLNVILVITVSISCFFLYYGYGAEC